MIHESPCDPWQKIRCLQFEMNKKVIDCLIILTFFLLLPALVHAERFVFERPEMGVMFRIIVHADDEVAVKKAVDAAFDQIRNLNAIMSDYDDDSELMQLSQHSANEFDSVGKAPWVKVSDDLFSVLESSKRFAELSEGAFDITVASVVRLWRRAKRMGKPPTQEQLERAMELVGNDLWELDKQMQSVRLKKKSVRFDLGAIGKGYAIDRAFEILQAAGFDTVLVDAGGDMRVGKAPPDGWKIGILESNGKTITFENRALATSGDTFQFVEFDGVRYSHIIDPKTGYGLTSPLIVRVFAPTACDADALASACSVLGVEGSSKLLKFFPEAKVDFVEQR